MIVRPKVEDYALQYTSPEPPHLAALAAETRQVSAEPFMMVGPIEGQLLGMFVHMLQPRRVLEVGTFMGYSALSMASMLPPGGQIITCEINPRYASIARRHIAATQWADQIEVRVGPGLSTVATLEGPFDLIFVDADKSSYAEYFERLLPKVSDRGVLIFDDALLLGQVIADSPPNGDIAAIQRFNTVVRDDPRVEQVVLTVRQGITIIRRV